MSQQLDRTVNAPSDTEEAASRTLTRTDVHDVLSNERRITLLELLAEESPQELGDLAEAIAARETGQRPPPRNIRQSVYVTLHQTHLPKLETLGIVEYDARAKVVARTSRADLVHEREREPSETPTGAGVEAYLCLVVVGLLGSVASVGGVAPFAAIAPSWYALGSLLALLVGFAYRIGRDGSSLGARLRERFA